MWNEHFGIGIVEMMAAGLIVVAHNSGGPKSDIITDVGKSGFLATTDAEYADCINEALTMSTDRADRIRGTARKSSARFSDEVFAKSFEKAVLDSGVLAPVAA